MNVRKSGVREKASLNTQTSKTSRCYTGKTALKLEQRKIRIVSLFCCEDYTSCTVRELQPDWDPQLLWHNLTDWGEAAASELNGSCVCEQELIERTVNSCAQTHTEHGSPRPEPTAAAMCMPSATAPFYSQGISQTVPIRSVWVVHVEEVLFLPSYWYGNS